MLEKIDSSDITVQIEASSQPRIVKDGLAVSAGLKNRDMNYFFIEDWNPGPKKTESVKAKSLYGDPGNIYYTAVGDWSTPPPAPSWAEFDQSTGVITITRSVYAKVTSIINVRGYYAHNSNYYGYNGQVNLYHRRVDGTGSQFAHWNNIPNGLSTKTRNDYINFSAGDQLWIRAHYYDAYNTFYPIYDIEYAELRFEEIDSTKAILPQNYVFAGDTIRDRGKQGFVATPSYTTEGKAKIAEAIMTASVTTAGGRTWVSGHWTRTFGVDGFTDVWVSGYYTGEPTYIDEFRVAASQARGKAQGPIIMQSRVPIPVNSGDGVNFQGEFSIRKPGGTMKTDAGASTAIDIRASIWGVGIVSDEYGIDHLNPKELRFFQATLSGPTDQGQALVKYTLPEMEDSIIPPGITGVYFTVSYVQAATGSYSAINNLTRNSSTASSNNPPSSSNPSTQNPPVFVYNALLESGFRLIHKPQNEKITPWEQTSSRTGVAYRDSQIFSGVRPGATVALWGFSEPATVNIYNNENGVRGSLIKTVVVPDRIRTEVLVDPTASGIELDSTSTFFTESVTNPISPSTESYIENKVERVNFLNINDHITKISILREEGRVGSATINFASSEMDPIQSDLLKIGKRIRIMGRHYGPMPKSRPPSWPGSADFDEIFVGTIKSINTEYDYLEEEPIIQVIAYDSSFDIQLVQDTGAYVDFHSYIPYLNRLGIDAIVNGSNFGGPKGSMPNKGLYWPMALPENLYDGLILTRNRNKGHFYVNRKNQLILNEGLPDEEPFTFTDGTVDGDISYGNMKMALDTDTMINQISVIEHRIDWDDFMGRSMKQGDPPPQNFQYPKETTMTAVFKEEELIEMYGEYNQSFDVVRGSGKITDIYMNNYGSGFVQWADDILDEYAEPGPMITKVTVPVKSSADIWTVSNIDILTPIEIVYKNKTQNSRVKSIDMVITPGKWYVDYEFDSRDLRTFWD